MAKETFGKDELLALIDEAGIIDGKQYFNSLSKFADLVVARHEASAAITVNLNIFDDEGNVVDGTTAEMTLAQISDVVDHASQLVLVLRSGRRSSGDTTAVLNQLEEALESSGVLESFEGNKSRDVSLGM